MHSSAINEKEDEPGNEVDNKVENGGLFYNGKCSLFQRLVVYYQLKITCKYFEVSPENDPNENACCQADFTDVCDAGDKAYRIVIFHAYNKLL